MSDNISFDSDRVTEEHVPPVKQTIRQLENQPRPRDLDNGYEKGYTPAVTPVSSRGSADTDTVPERRNVKAVTPRASTRTGHASSSQHFAPSTSRQAVAKSQQDQPAQNNSQVMSTMPEVSQTPRATNEPSPEFNVDVDALNHCLRDIESFANRTTPALPRLIEYRNQVSKGLSKKKREKWRDDLIGQIPASIEFVDIFQKYKLALNLVAHLRDYLNNPTAEQLPSILLGPFEEVLQVCNLSHSDIAPRVISPLFTADAKHLMNENLNEHQRDVIHNLGDAWTLSEIQWDQAHPLPYIPRFSDGYIPYREAITVGFFNERPTRITVAEPEVLQVQAPNRNIVKEEEEEDTVEHIIAAIEETNENQSNHDSSEVSSQAENKIAEELLAIQKQTLSLLREKEERIDDERERMDAERKRIEDERNKLLHEKVQLEEEKIRIIKNEESSRRASMSQPSDNERSVTSQQDFNTALLHVPEPDYETHIKQHWSRSDASQWTANANLVKEDKRIFLNDLIEKRAKIGQVMFGLAGQDPKQLSVEKGEFVEVLDDRRNWWRCKNGRGMVGYVPYTVLTVIKAVAPADSTLISEKEQKLTVPIQQVQLQQPQQQQQRPQMVVERIVERVPVVYRAEPKQPNFATRQVPPRRYSQYVDRSRPALDARQVPAYKPSHRGRRPSYSPDRHRRVEDKIPRRPPPQDRRRDRRRSPSRSPSSERRRRHSPRGRVVSPSNKHRERMVSPRRPSRHRGSDEDIDTSPGGWNPEMMGPGVPNAVKERIGRLGWSYI